MIFGFLFFFSLQLIFHGVAGQQCQCISPDVAAATSNCLGYDSKMQADTIDEAIASFPDLSLDNLNSDSTMSLGSGSPEKITDFQSASSTPPSDAGCVTEECQDCQKALRKRLQKIGLLAPDINSIISANTNSTTTCKKYRFTIEKQQKKNKKKHDDDDSDSSSDEDDEEKVKKEEEKKQEKKEKKELKKEEKKAKKEAEKKNRDKRQAVTPSAPGGITSSTTPEIIGTRFTISCSVKGISTDPTGTVSLCSSCWVWRKLPDNYRPQYINELVCDTSDNACLSGYATCSVGHRTFEAVRSENGVNTTVSLSAGSYCECRVTAGSSLQSLVNGGGISGVFNPMGQTSQTASVGVEAV